MNTRWVLYHKNCYDGFGAGWAARNGLAGRNVKFVAMDYHDPMPSGIADGDIVYMVDYSRNSVEEMRELGKRCAVVILDHHKTAKDNLMQLRDEIEIHFDMEKSGAVLSWEYFNPLQPVPAFLLDIQDRDLWKFERENTRAVHSALMAHPYDFEVWDRFNTLVGYENLVKKGKPLADYEANIIELMCKNALMMEIGGYEVPVVNATTLFSDVVHRLLQLYPDAPFAAYRIYLADGNIRFGLRSRGDFDVSKVALIYGGGGHEPAAGFVIVDDGNLQKALILGLLSTPAVG